MSRLMKEVLVEDQTPAPVNADQAFAAYSMEQMSMQDREEHQSRLLMELDELCAVQRTLEERRALHLAEPEMSMESQIATRAILTDLFGEGLYSKGSLESADAGEATLEGISEAMGKISRAIRSKYETLMESIRWINDSLFNGLGKSEAYLRGAAQQVDRLSGTMPEQATYTSPSLATNYLHFTGKGDVESILKGLRQSTEAFSVLIDAVSGVRGDLHELAREAAQEALDGLGKAKTESDIEASINRAYSEAVKKAERLTGKRRQAITDLSGMAVSGGREIEYKPARRFGESPEVKLDIVDSRGEAPKTLQLPTKEQLVELIAEAQAATDALRKRKATYEEVVTSFFNLLDEKTAGEDVGKPNKPSDESLGLDLYTAFVLLYFSFLFSLMTITVPVMAIFAGGFTISAIIQVVRSIYKVIRGDYKDGKFGTKQERVNEILNDAMKGPIANASAELVRAMNDYAKFQNTVVKASLVYIHSGLEAHTSTK